MKPKSFNQRRKNLVNQFYLKYYMQQAGNDAPQLKKEMNSILTRLEKILI